MSMRRCRATRSGALVEALWRSAAECYLLAADSGEQAGKVMQQCVAAGAMWSSLSAVRADARRMRHGRRCRAAARAYVAAALFIGDIYYYVSAPCRLMFSRITVERCACWQAYAVFAADDHATCHAVSPTTCRRASVKDDDKHRLHYVLMFAALIALSYALSLILRRFSTAPRHRRCYAAHACLILRHSFRDLRCPPCLHASVYFA